MRRGIGNYITLALLSFLATPVLADKLVIGLGNFEPFFAKPNTPALFKDVIDSVYRQLPHRQVSYQYMLSNARLLKELNDGTVDGSANIFNANEVKGCLTEPTFKYKDVIIALKSKSFDINKLSDLEDKSIVTYQRARNLLGEEFREVTEYHLEYQEVAKPAEQAKLLATGLVDVSIGDKYLFLHSLQQWQLEDVKPEDFVFYELFPAVYSAMAFKKQEHCDEFDQGLVKFKRSGGYDALYTQYLNKLGYHH